MPQLIYLNKKREYAAQYMEYDEGTETYKGVLVDDAFFIGIITDTGSYYGANLTGSTPLEIYAALSPHFNHLLVPQHEFRAKGELCIISL